MAVAGKFNIQVGSLNQSRMTLGERDGVCERIALSSEERAELAAVFAELKSTVADQVPEAMRDEALARAEQLEQAVVREQPDPRSVRRVLRWFRAHAPHLAGPVMSVLVSPLVGKLVDGSGAVISDRFRALLEPVADDGHSYNGQA